MALFACLCVVNRLLDFVYFLCRGVCCLILFVVVLFLDFDCCGQVCCLLCFDLLRLFAGLGLCLFLLIWFVCVFYVCLFVVG